MNEAKVTLGRVAIEGTARGFEFFSVTPDTDLADQYVPAEIADAILAALTAPTWLVWSNEHAAWWGPDRCHYYTDVSAAGRYTLEEAMAISRLRGGSQKTRETGNPSEMIQPSPEWVEARNAAIRKATGEVQT